MNETNEELQEETKVTTGKINFISEDGWGFIISKDIPFERIFFHWTALRGDTLNFKEIEEGMIVEFIPVKVPDKGWRGVKIKVVKE